VRIQLKFFLYTFLYCFTLFSQTDFSETGSPVGAEKFTLYRGEYRQLVGVNLSATEVDSIMLVESNVWYLEIYFQLTKQQWLNNNLYIDSRYHFSSSEIYLNDELFLKNGVVGFSPETEEKDHFRIYEHISPTRVNPGWNKLTVKFSNYNLVGDTFKTYFYLFFGDKDHMSKSKRFIYVSLFLGGFFILALVFNIALFFANDKKKSHLFLCLFFAGYTFMMVKEFVYHELNPSPFYVDFLRDLFYISDLFSKIMLFFGLMFQFYKSFNIKQYEWITLICVSLFHLYLVSTFKDNTAKIGITFYISLLPPLLITLRALYDKIEGSILTLSGILIFFLFSYLDFQMQVDLSYFGGVFVYGFIMMVSFSRNLQKENKAHHESKLRSATLENQLLQKHIQPHFIMNSLMSLQELIDTSAPEAAQLVEALSEEFHLLAEVRNEKLIEISRELEICRVHLKIFGIQKCSTFRLETRGINGNEKIPPAIIHTLVENGLTHGYHGISDGYFLLTKENINDRCRYTLFNDSRVQPTKKKRGSGTGLSYIRSRLEESYRGEWSLLSYPVDGGWEAVIEFKENV